MSHQSAAAIIADIKKGRVPRNFEHWHRADSFGETLAEMYLRGYDGSVSARRPWRTDVMERRLGSVEDWAKLKTRRQEPLIFDFAGRGIIPAGFRQWELRAEDGATVAHAAGLVNALPANFEKWSLADKNGWTVAHEVAKRHPQALPEGFDLWDMKDHHGRSVRDVMPAPANQDLFFDEAAELRRAIENDRVPKGFKDWSREDAFGVSMAERYLEGYERSIERGHIYHYRPWRADKMERHLATASTDDWRQMRTKNSYDLLVLRFAEHKVVPHGFEGWSISAGGSTVAHTAAKAGHLPEHFEHWHLRDASGLTVKDVAIESGAYTCEHAEREKAAQSPPICR